MVRFSTCSTVLGLVVLPALCALVGNSVTCFLYILHHMIVVFFIFLILYYKFAG